MRVVKCENGHFIDHETYDKCPVCGAGFLPDGVKEKSKPKNEDEPSQKISFAPGSKSKSPAKEKTEGKDKKEKKEKREKKEDDGGKKKLWQSFSKKGKKDGQEKEAYPVTVPHTDDEEEWKKEWKVGPGLPPSPDPENSGAYPPQHPYTSDIYEHTVMPAENPEEQDDKTVVIIPDGITPPDVRNYGIYRERNYTPQTLQLDVTPPQMPPQSQPVPPQPPQIPQPQPQSQPVPPQIPQPQPQSQPVPPQQPQSQPVPPQQPQMPRQQMPQQRQAVPHPPGNLTPMKTIMGGVLSDRLVAGWLVCYEGEMQGVSYDVAVGNNTIGRNIGMDISIADQTISADRQATLTFDPKSQAFFIKPGEGKALMYFNDEEEYFDERRKLTAYDRLTIGNAKFVFIPLCGEKFNWNDYVKKEE